LRSQTEALKRLSVTEPHLATQEHLDSLQFIYGKGDPNAPDATVQHLTTQGELKARNKERGRNHIFLASACVITIYQYWEGYFRGRIASAVGLPEDEIRAPVFGDLRKLRNAIIHNLGVATSDVETCTILVWFKRGDGIEITKEQFQNMVDEIHKYADQMLS
jgi:hypothetical protein